MPRHLTIAHSVRRNKAKLGAVARSLMGQRLSETGRAIEVKF
jgi:hypothetical protein